MIIKFSLFNVILIHKIYQQKQWASILSLLLSPKVEERAQHWQVRIIVEQLHK